MAKFKLFLTISFVIILLCGCTEPQETAPTLPAAELYDQMAQTLCDLPKITMRYTEITTMAQGSNTYTYEDRQQILLDTVTGDFQSSGTIYYGTHNVVYDKVYQNRTLYLTVNNGKFSGGYINPQSFLPKPGMFSEHALSVNGNEILFSDPTGSFWVLPEYANIITAHGSLAKTNILQYNITYEADNTTFQTAVTLEYEASDASISLLNANTYTPIGNVTAPLALEKAYGLLQQSTHVSGNFLEEISSQVNTLQYTHQLVLSRQGESGSVIKDTKLTNYSRRDDCQTRIQKEEFQKGNYTISIDDNPPQTQNIEQDQFFEYFMQLLSEHVMAAKYVIQANAELTDNGILLNISPNHALAENLYAHLWKTLYPYQDYLGQQLTDHHISYEILIDPVSCLPLCCRLEFSNHTAIEGIPYPLTASQQLTILYA